MINYLDIHLKILGSTLNDKNNVVEIIFTRYIALLEELIFGVQIFELNAIKRLSWKLIQVIWYHILISINFTAKHYCDESRNLQISCDEIKIFLIEYFIRGRSETTLTSKGDFILPTDFSHILTNFVCLKTPIWSVFPKAVLHWCILTIPETRTMFVKLGN